MSKHKAKMAKKKLARRIAEYERLPIDAKRACKKPGSLNVKKN